MLRPQKIHCVPITSPAMPVNGHKTVPIDSISGTSIRGLRELRQLSQKCHRQSSSHYDGCLRGFEGSGQEQRIFSRSIGQGGSVEQHGEQEAHLSVELWLEFTHIRKKAKNKRKTSEQRPINMGTKKDFVRSGGRLNGQILVAKVFVIEYFFRRALVNQLTGIQYDCPIGKL